MQTMYCSVYLCMHMQACMLNRSGVVELIGQRYVYFKFRQLWPRGPANTGANLHLNHQCMRMLPCPHTC